MGLNARLLVVDDDPAQRRMLADFFRDIGAEVREAESGIEALELVRRISPDVVLTDLRMPGLDGAELLREIKKINPEIGVVLVTAYGTVQGAVECLRDGADDYLLKPLELDEVEHVVRRALEQRHLTRENLELKRRLGEIESIPGIVTSGGQMAEILSTVDRVARSTVSLLIQGESGTGKELIARAVHAAGPRSNGPFVAVNAAALSPTLLESELFGHEKGAFTGASTARSGRFEAASGGTIFLDEIGDLPAEVQVKLLRVLQERSVERVGSNQSVPIDVRVIAATHQDLLALVKEGSFREDLYYRLVVVSIELPPLRRRKSDIPLLVDHFLAKHREEAEGQEKRFSREAMDLLVGYDFPGNVRELENIVRRCVVLARGEQITMSDLPPIVMSTATEGATGDEGEANGSLPARLAALEKQVIEESLAETGGNQSRAAGLLGISERALRYKLTKIRGRSTD